MKNPSSLGLGLFLSFTLFAFSLELRAQEAPGAMQPYFVQSGNTLSLATYKAVQIRQGPFYQLLIKGSRGAIKRSECRLVYGQDEQEWTLGFEKQEGRRYRLLLPENLPAGNYKLIIATRYTAINRYFNLLPEEERKEYSFSIR